MTTAITKATLFLFRRADVRLADQLFFIHFASSNEGKSLMSLGPLSCFFFFVVDVVVVLLLLLVILFCCPPFDVPPKERGGSIIRVGHLTCSGCRAFACW